MTKVIFDYYWPQTSEDIMDAMDHMRHIGGVSNTAAALKETRDSIYTVYAGWREKYPGLIILVTDGIQTTDVDQLVEMSNSIKKMGISIIVVGLSNQVCYYKKAVFQHKHSCLYLYIP